MLHTPPPCCLERVSMVQSGKPKRLEKRCKKSKIRSASLKACGVDYDGWSPLLIACADNSAGNVCPRQRAQTVKLLTERGASLNDREPSFEAFTALQLAADRGYTEVRRPPSRPGDARGAPPASARSLRV